MDAGRPVVMWVAAFSAGLLVADFLAGHAVVLVAAASLGGVAFSVTQVVVTGAIPAALPTSERGAGLGLLNLSFFIGGAIGAADH